MDFERGQDPKKSMNIGYESFLEELGIKIFERFDLFQHSHHFFETIEQVTYHNVKGGQKQIFEAVVVIIKMDGRFKYVKNRFLNDGDDLIYPIEKLPEHIFELKEKRKIEKTK